MYSWLKLSAVYTKRLALLSIPQSDIEFTKISTTLTLLLVDSTCASTARADRKFANGSNSSKRKNPKLLDTIPRDCLTHCCSKTSRKVKLLLVSISKSPINALVSPSVIDSQFKSIHDTSLRKFHDSCRIKTTCKVSVDLPRHQVSLYVIYWRFSAAHRLWYICNKMSPRTLHYMICAALIHQVVIERIMWFKSDKFVT